MELRSKLPWVGTTIFTQMSQLAAEHQAINLSQGFPDFSASPLLLDEIQRQIFAGNNQYAPMTGVAVLRQQIAALTARCYGRQIDADTEVTVTSGATEALFVAIQAVVRPGDEVIVFDPAYDSYQPAVELAGGKTIHIQLAAPEYHIDWQAVNRRVTEQTRLIIVNSPHNPTGMVFSAADWRALADLVQRHGLFCISDEVYEHIVFDHANRLSAHQQAALLDRTFVISSFGKTFHVTGWKLGYCIAPANLSLEFRKIHQYVTFSSFTPAQFAIAKVLEHEPQLVVDLADFYQEKRDLFAHLLQPSALRLLPCQGTYFQLVDYSAVSTLNDVEFCHWLTKQHGVAAIPMSVFSRQEQDSKIVRLCFAKQQATLEQAAERLNRLTP
ncbi:MAG: aminotransferase class I/II-fold pyridoxal phosphate-dependent enzyme [Gammaproteobacteria bacterium]|nr:aminotransferase class I/II-fold pyridoxal phosphate-dependent enzyme [Gammaproteobacteria bacterium]MBU2280616.1 aminotransferase class I/II-fold pyridoxal phosphate-dependent enzyme [Gammaproteobacteria bacterium]MBU2425482.1 aminotransferase class I/II-fold pyridoxal phosphate-dependent enzyme [Gammaproteobacteria bacterium]